MEMERGTLPGREKRGAEKWKQRRAWRRAGRSLLFLLCFLLPMGGCAEEPEEVRPERAVPVETVTVPAEVIHETVQSIGTLVALQSVEIRPEISGFVREIGFQETAMVEEGEVLYRLSDEKLQRELEADQAALQAARSRLEMARQTYERRRDLVERQLISREDFEQVRSELNQAEAEVEQLQARIELSEERVRDTVLRAPFNGLISENLVELGGLVEPGQVLTTLYFLDELEMEFAVAERHSGRIAPGQRVEVMTAARPEMHFSGSVDFVSPVVEEATRDFKVKARIDNRERLLKPGSFGRARVVVETREERPVIPEEGLVPLREGYAVFVVEEGVARLRPVRLGLRIPGRVEIREGLRPGEVVVRTGHMQLADGDAVREIGHD